MASFHVDQGPIMEHQYPGAISGDENMLAELMLPDQVHNRKEDWTIFFLHKDLSEEADGVDREELEGKEGPEGGEENGVHDNGVAEGGKASTKEVEDGEEKEDAEGGEGPPLIYVLNLVNTKHDPTAKRLVGHSFQLNFCLLTNVLDRGAVVKAMAICTRHPFLHIYKVA